MPPIGLRLPYPVTAPSAAIVSLVCIAFVPFGIPNLSYNTLGSLCFTLGIFAAARTIFEAEGRPAVLAASGVVHGLAILAYPPLIVPAGAFAFSLALLVSRSRIRATAAYVGGGLAVGRAPVR